MSGALHRLLYAQGWEDPAVLRAALRLSPGDRALSIAAAGDNSFALLLDDPEEVVAVDRNATQLHLVRLKIAILRTLDREDALELLGESPSHRREALFASVAGALEPDTRAFWRQPRPRRWLSSGVVLAGKFERYLALFGEWVMPLVHNRATVERLLGLGDREEQERFYREVWDSPRWRLLFRLFFSRRVMERAGRDRSFFAHVDADRVGDIFRERARRTLVDLPPRDNPYISWILTGEHRASRLLPPYLQPGSYELVQSRVDRIRLVEGDLTDVLREHADGSRFDAFNLSDVFEYLSVEQSEALYRALVDAARDGARTCYWNLLVPRSAPAAFADTLVGEPELAERLHAMDRAPFYGRVVVERRCAR